MIGECLIPHGSCFSGRSGPISLCVCQGPGRTADAVWRVAWPGAAGRGPGSRSPRCPAEVWPWEVASGTERAGGSRVCMGCFLKTSSSHVRSHGSPGCTGPTMRAAVRGCGWKRPRTPSCENAQSSASVRAREGWSASGRAPVSCKPGGGDMGPVGRSLSLGVRWEIVLTRGQGEEAARQTVSLGREEGRKQRQREVLGRDCDPATAKAPPRGGGPELGQCLSTWRRRESYGLVRETMQVWKPVASP